MTHFWCNNKKWFEQELIDYFFGPVLNTDVVVLGRRLKQPPLIYGSFIYRSSKKGWIRGTKYCWLNFRHTSLLCIGSWGFEPPGLACQRVVTVVSTSAFFSFLCSFLYRWIYYYKTDRRLRELVLVIELYCFMKHLWMLCLFMKCFQMPGALMLSIFTITQVLNFLTS